MTVLWRAPIIVTTAVAFFETLASNRPSTLRRLHELPGSLIFVDEAHASLPVRLLPLTWYWMRIFSEEWSCQWVLSSGSLVKYWTLKSDELEINNMLFKESEVESLVPEKLRQKLSEYEQTRVDYIYEPAPFTREQLVQLVLSAPGPRLVIMNTVRNAALIAEDLRKAYGPGKADRVLHLSTALTPEDRDLAMNDILQKLRQKDETEWVLVATSCVEAGVNLSFRSGFREIASLLSLLQIAGRINRDGQYEDAAVYSFAMQDGQGLTRNPEMELSSRILEKYLKKRVTIDPSLSTDSIQKELAYSSPGFQRQIRQLVDAELNFNFPYVAENFHVIEEDSERNGKTVQKTILVLPDSLLAEKIRNGDGNWKIIQEKTVSVRESYAAKYHLPRLADGLYEWTLDYDSFLGIMRGVLDHLEDK